MLKVYGFSKVNAVARTNTRDLRVLWALEEMGIPFEIVGMDHPAKALESDAYGTLSPFHQIPAIDDDGVVLSESGGILVYLAKKSGRLIPRDLAGEAQVVRWCFAALNTLELPLLSLMLLSWIDKDDAAKAYRETMIQIANRHLTSLDHWLEGREFVATDSFSVADIMVAHVLFVFKEESLFAPYARVRAYRDRCKERPAWKRAFENYCERVEAA